MGKIICVSVDYIIWCIHKVTTIYQIIIINEYFFICNGIIN